MLDSVAPRAEQRLASNFPAIFYWAAGVAGAGVVLAGGEGGAAGVLAVRG